LVLAICYFMHDSDIYKRLNKRACIVADLLL
jgi:hypothetical protein